MDILNIVLIVCIFIIIYYFIKKFFGSTPEKDVRSTALKKSEIIDGFEHQMREILITYANDEKKLKEKKTQLLKQISTQLATNIFFDKVEVRNIIQKLVNMH